MQSQSATQAEQFRAGHKDYFFEEAHFHVEALASVEAKEIAHNLFEFPDGSILRIGTNVQVVQTYANKEQFDAFVAMRTNLPNSVILPQDC
jgi:hypothetical protein